MVIDFPSQKKLISVGLFATFGARGAKSVSPQTTAFAVLVNDPVHTPKISAYEIGE